MNLRAPGVLARLLAFVAASALPLAAHSQVVTGSFAPPQVGSNTASTLTLSYAGFTSDSVGMVLRVYYDSAKVTAGSVSYNNPPGFSQPANSPAAGTLAGCTGANTFIALNWLELSGGTWPTPAAGQLATVAFTSANPFTTNALVCWVDDTSQGAPERDITGNATLNAPPPTATIAVAPASVLDNGSALTYTVTISPPPASTTPVTIATSSVVGAMTGVVNGCTGTVSVSTGGTGTCTISATNTVPFDGPATATVTLGAGAGYVVGVLASAAATITNDDLPTVSIAALPASIFDSADNVSTVTVTLSVAAPVGGFPVTITPPPTLPARYTTTCGSSLTITAGNTTAACTVTATANATVGDGPATAPVAIAASGTYNIIGTNPAVVTIQDDDIPVMSAVCTPTTLTDSAGQTSTCTISSDKALVAPLTVNLNPPADARYTTSCVGTIDVPAGAAGTANTCTISAVANTTIGDGNVTASLSVAAGTGYTAGGSTQNVAINNDDFASISVAVAPDSVAENSGTPMVYTFTASAVSTSATSILFTPPAASGRYGTTCASPITLPATQTIVTCSVTPIDNGVLDGSATATVTVLANAGVYTVGAPAVATGTITDNEIGIGVTTISQAVEGGSPGTFRVCRSGSTAAELVVAGTLGGNAVQGTDYTLSGNVGNTVVIPAGSACADLVVTAIDNGAPNGSRTVTLTLTPTQEAQLIPGQGSASMSIVDDDLPTTIPTLSTLGLILLSLLLAAAMGFTTRRRRI